MISCSRVGLRPSGGRSSRTKIRQSCMVLSGLLRLCDAFDCADKFAPRAALLGQGFPSCRCEFVKAPPPLAGFFEPTAFDPAAAFEPVQHGVKRCDVKFQNAF